ncbi:uncharacterized protein LOC115433980 [Sphaeramia orbicularis]|uniref:uncharacterized protein LOC115433980 n=1 Tax=Sphaeramia orbicularis TaxID=375764 RepID=UPI00117C8786|nr:uncharacterized protein LOC115433980 [Sphaeramia orbicularis]XP_030011471.1 uncharacterized protein LOC115433980 [Sphaeramia orbicularis]
MGQLFSSEEELSQAKDLIGGLLYNAMLEGGAVPNLAVVHPLLLANHNKSSDSTDYLQEQLQQLQRDIGNRAPTYLRDLIGRLSSFSDEPRLAGLVGLVVSMVIDMVYTSSRRPSGVKEKSSGSYQKVCELQEVMEEYLKRCRINLTDQNRLMQDTVRLEAQLSLNLTQLKTCLLRGDCDSRSLRQWASGAAFHTQMLVHLAALEGKTEPLAARAALEQYKEDITQITPVYRRYKSSTVSVVKRRGSLLASCEPSNEIPEDGAMTGITVTDRETGKNVTIPLSVMERETGRGTTVGVADGTSGPVASSLNLDLITSDQYAQAYLDCLFSDKGPVAELESHFTKASDNLSMLTTGQQSTSRAGMSNVIEPSDRVHFKHCAEGIYIEQPADEGGKGDEQDETLRRAAENTDGRRDESLKLSIVETQPDESRSQGPHGTTEEMQ